MNHIQAAWKYKNKTAFSPCASGQLSIEPPVKSSSSSKLFAAEDQVLNTKMFKHCKHKYILYAANDSNKKYYTFPEFEIVRIYMQKADKIKCMIQFGIAPVIRDITFNLDETTTYQIKKWHGE